MQSGQEVNEEIVLNILQAVQLSNPANWRLRSLYAANNEWLHRKTDGNFPAQSTVGEKPNGIHFLFLKTKVWQNKANQFSPCSSQRRSGAASILPDKPLLHSVTDNGLPFKLHHPTYIRGQIKINIWCKSSENRRLFYKGVVGRNIINDYHCLFKSKSFKLYIVE